jgi:hypothetical protein
MEVVIFENKYFYDYYYYYYYYYYYLNVVNYAAVSVRLSDSELCSFYPSLFFKLFLLIFPV